MKRLYVGIDLGVEVCALAAMNGLGQIEKEVEFATSEKAIVKHVEDLGGSGPGDGRRVRTGGLGLPHVEG